MPILRSSNPAFARGKGFSTPSTSELDAMYATQPRLTIDDVIIHTVGLLALLGVTAVIGWQLPPRDAGLGFAAGLAALSLSFVIAFSRAIRPPFVIIFAALEGLFVGAISRAYNDQFSGIVAQALIGTGIIFGAMLIAYRSGRLRATPRMTRIVVGTLLGVVGLGLVDLGLRAFGSHVPILNDATPLGILVSLGILVVAALQFILDFDFIDRAIAAGAPRSEAWRASYGLLVGFVWVYLELLRLLSKIRR
jgi:uncharacterized YccA/Bax inhibitor family protein